MKDQDKDLHDARISELYRQLPDEQPSADSDALIRAAARRAVAAGPQKKYLSFDLKQLTATAAVLMLSVGLVVQWQSHEPEKLQEALSSTSGVTMSPAAESPAIETAPAPEKAADRAKAAPVRREDAVNALAEHSKKNTFQADAAEHEAQAGNSAPEMPDIAGAPMPAPAAPAAIAESRGETDALLDAPASAAKEKLMARAMEKSARREDAAAGALSAQRAMTADLMRERKMEAVASIAAEPQPALADYRTSMARGNYAQALETLHALMQPASAAALFVDRDMLRQLQDPKAAPECAHLSADKLGEEKPLCDLLGWHAKNKAVAPGWGKNAGLQPLISGEKSYRRPALDKLFTAEGR